jgi:elongation factor 1 alpha-like protein
MSRHRIKTIDFVEDDYGEGDEDDGYEDNNIVSPEDQEQMRVSTAEVRKLLDSEIPPVPASDQEIWEALWHYYYDVDKSVGYLRSVYSLSIP